LKNIIANQLFIYEFKLSSQLFSNKYFNNDWLILILDTITIKIIRGLKLKYYTNSDLNNRQIRKLYKELIEFGNDTKVWINF